MTKAAMNLEGLAIIAASEIGYIVYPVRRIGGDDRIIHEPIAAFHTVEGLNDWVNETITRQDWEE